MKKTVCVLGGDLRQKTVAGLLEEEGFKVLSVAAEGAERPIDDVKKAQILILPIPASSDGHTLNAPFAKGKILLSDITERIDKNCLVLGAKLPKAAEDGLKSRGIAYIDYFEREELIIQNAIPTAEGVIEIALSEMPITLFESRSLVVGYGRVGKVIAEKLAAMGSRVCVSARKCSDFAWIREKGFMAVHTDKIAEEAQGFDLVVNTVPAAVLTENALKNIRDDALILDVASKPGGVDFDAAKRLGKNVIWALSLPGKTAPITSGKIIKETVMNILSETGV